jgi:serine/threonine-protein kinase
MKAGQLVAGRYQLDARLGIGGMGEVWKATHTGTGREFALKFMHAHAAASASSRQRFTREARVSAKINHPNVIDIFDVGEVDDGILFLAMELLEGVSLADAFHADEPLTVQELLTLVLDTTRALVAAHAVGVVHRDIKPGNIFLHRDRATGFATAKILDFGISKLGGLDDSHHTKTGSVLGSPRYMSPEQARSAASVDQRADIWSVGVILFEGLTGTWPHEGDSFSSLVVAICTTPPLSIDLLAPDLPEPLRAVVRDCLKPVDERIQTAAELTDRIAAVITDPVLATWRLPRPLHPPSETLKSVSGVRVRPPLLTTTSGFGLSSQLSPDSLRATNPRLPGGPIEPPRYHDDEGATQIRALPDRSSSSVPAAPVSSRSPGMPALAQSSPGAASPFAQSSPGAASPFAQSSPGMPPPLAQSSPGVPSPFAAPSSPALPAPALAQSSPGVPSPFAAPSSPAFKAQLRTVPLQQGVALRDDLVRAGLLSPALDETAATVTRLMEPDSQASPGSAPPIAPSPAPAAPSPRPGVDLRLLAAALSVLLAGIVTALVLVLRSPPAGDVKAAASSASAAASAPSATAAPAPTPTVAAATASASAEPVASASATAAASAVPAGSSAPSADKKAAAAPGRTAPAGPRVPTKIQRLGSGL